MTAKLRAILRILPFLLLSGVLIPFYINCSGGPVSFSSNDSLTSKLIGSLRRENGGGYFGKPDQAYDHNQAGFTCEGKPSPLASIEFTGTNNATLTENTAEKCASQVQSIDFESIAVSNSTDLVVAFGEMIFSKREAGPDFYVDMWCHKPESMTEDLDIVIHRRGSDPIASSSMFIGSSQITPFTVTSAQYGSVLRYRSSAFDLAVDLAARTLMPMWPLRGHMEADIDNSRWVRDLGCRTPQTPLAKPNTWIEIPSQNAPSERTDEITLWTGTHFLVFGGRYEVVGSTSGWADRRDGKSLDLATGEWRQFEIPVGHQLMYMNHKWAWSGRELLILGTTEAANLYDPAAHSMKTITMPWMRPDRQWQVVWTDQGFLFRDSYYIPGESDGPEFLLYEPSSDKWTQFTSQNPIGWRHGTTLAWTGEELIVWGGSSKGTGYVNSGAVFNLASRTWRSTSTLNAPTPRSGASGLWTGSQLIIWGAPPQTACASGAVYDLNTDTWQPISTVNAPLGSDMKSVWTGTRMVAWGSASASGCETNPDIIASSFDPTQNRWVPLNVNEQLRVRTNPSLSWTGNELIFWGGTNSRSSADSQELLRLTDGGVFILPE